jgi:hypothetical protein
MELLTRSQIVNKIDQVDALLSSADKWTKDAGARDAERNKLSKPDDPRAVCWCLRGAVWKVTENPEHSAQVLAALREVTGNYISVGEFNDSATFAEVKELLQQAKVAAANMEPWEPPASANGALVGVVVGLVVAVAAAAIFIK